MSPPRSVVVLAMLAALVLAPSSVFAAAPNELRSAAVTPASGTTATVFALSVGYRSPAGNPANDVTATVAGKIVELWLTSGSAVDGTWTGSTTLPAGFWMVAFQANASKGADPTTIVGPISVSLVVTQPHSSPVIGQPSTDMPDPGEVGTTAEPKPQPSAASSASGSTASAGGKTRPSGGAAAAATAAPSPSRAGHKQSPHGRSAGPRASTSPDGAAPAQPTATATTDDRAQAEGREQVGLVLLFGIASVAAVGLLGAAWILIASRRDRAEPSVVAVPHAHPAIPAIPTADQRAVRRARLRPSDDPILAALGLNDEEPPPTGEQGDKGANARRFRRAARK